MRNTAPPRSAAWLLARLLPQEQRDAVLGDLAEEHSLRMRTGHAPNEGWWYWSQVTRSVAPLVWATILRGRWIAVLAAGIAAYAVVNLVESAGTALFAKVFASEGIVYMTLSLAFPLAAMVLGGYVATRLRRGAAGALAVISAVSVMGLMLRSPGFVPLWITAAWLVACPVTALAGGALVRKRENARV